MNGLTSSSTEAASVGDTVYYKLEVQVPDYTTAGREFAILVTLPDTWYIQNTDSPLVFYGDSESAAEGDTAIPQSGNTVETAGYGIYSGSDGLPLNEYIFYLNDPATKDLAGKYVTFVYGVCVGSQVLGDTPTVDKSVTVAGKNVTTAVLTFSPDDVTEYNSEDDSTYATTDPVTTTVYTYGITLNKLGSDKGTTQLAGAKFNLYKAADYKTNGSNATVYGTLTTSNATDATNTFSKRVGDGTYTVVETSAPAGYTPVAPFDVVINTSSDQAANPIAYSTSGTVSDSSIYGATAVYAQGTTTAATGAALTANPSSDSVSYNIAVDVTDPTSNSGLLPGTGGTGTVALTILGLLIMAGAATAIVRNRRKCDTSK